MYTRTTDTLIALVDRGRIANDAHADLFISIHVNAANPELEGSRRGARGFETYFLAEAKTEDARRVEQMENEVVKFETRTVGARGRSAQLHPQRHGAERAPARVERARGADPAPARRGCTRARAAA